MADPVNPMASPLDGAEPSAKTIGYITFVDPTSENGIHVFARIADELGRLRPDIPLLVVEGAGTEETLASCGLDLTVHGNVNLMGRPEHPGEYWTLTRALLLPSPGGGGRHQVAMDALANGVPVIGCDHADVRRMIGEAGVILPLPGRSTSGRPSLPTADEIAPWVDAVIRLWDDQRLYDELRSRIAEESRRLATRISVPGDSKRRQRAVVLVPHLNGIDWECDASLHRLETAGVRVIRRGGSSAVDLARNVLASDALHDGFEKLLFIDADIGFDAADALRLLDRPEVVVSGVYAKKGCRAFASAFADGIEEVVFGPKATHLYPLKYAATGFLRIDASVLRRMISELDLPSCNGEWGREIWPFFHPAIISHGNGHHYLGEDWSFSHRLRAIGVTPMADTSIRLWHYGRYAYGWEDAGFEVKRFSSYTYRFITPGE